MKAEESNSQIISAQKLFRFVDDKIAGLIGDKVMEVLDMIYWCFAEFLLSFESFEMELITAFKSNDFEVEICEKKFVQIAEAWGEKMRIKIIRMEAHGSR